MEPPGPSEHVLVAEALADVAAAAVSAAQTALRKSLPLRKTGPPSGWTGPKPAASYPKTASVTLIGGRPSRSSTVATIALVSYCVESTLPACVYGLISSATVRCASTWSGPFWASSSVTRIIVLAQNLLCETTSTSRPSATSL